MENQKVQGVNFYMIAWQVLEDELCIARSRMEQEETDAIEKVMNYLAKRYMNRVVSALRVGRNDSDILQEIMSETLMQRMAKFNEPIHYRKPNDKTPKPQFEDGV